MAEIKQLTELISTLGKIADIVCASKATDSFNESAHKRASNGQFGSGGGTAASSKASKSDSAKKSAGNRKEMNGAGGHTLTVTESGKVILKNSQGVMVHPSNAMPGKMATKANKEAFNEAARQGPAALEKLTGQKWTN